MAGNAETIRSFLVSLGFAVDKPSLKKFDDQIDKSTKEILLLGTAAAGVATGVELMMRSFAHSMESLYYASRRTGAAVGNLQAIGYAAEQIGIKAEDAQGMLEGMTRAMRLNPGLSGLLKNLGINPNDRNNLLQNFAAKLKTMPFNIAAKYGEMFGIDPDKLFMLMDKLQEFEDGQKRRLELGKELNINADEAAVASREYANTLRDLWMEVSLLADKIMIDMLPSFREGARAASEFFTDLIKGKSDLANFVGDLIPWGDTVKAVFWAVSGAIERLSKVIYGNVTAWSALAHGDIKGAAAAFIQLYKDAFGGPGKSDKEKEADKRNEEDASPRLSTGKIKGLQGAVSSVTGGSAAPGGHEALGIRNNNPGNLRSWGSTPTSGGFAQFATPEAGLSAMAGNLLAYEKKGLDTVSAIINRWAPSSENDTNSYIGDVAKKLGVGANDKLNLHDPATLQRLMQAITMHENGYNPYSADLIANAANSRLGGSAASGSGGGANVVANTTIHLSGVSDPQEAARLVASNQTRVFGDVIRNVGTNLQ
jgi:hypothetical protein